jgi:hypothetical protein
MSEKKGWGSKVLDLWVVRDDKGAGGAPSPAADATGTSASTPAPGAPADGESGSPDGSAGDGAAAAAPGFVHAPPAAPGGQVDFAAVYAAAGIDDEEQARVAKAAELLHALPAGIEPARQIVEASLKAFGVPVEKIIAAGEKQLRALDAYVETGAADTRKVLAESQERIAQYQQEIQQIRQVMDQRVAEQQGVERACAGGKQEVARVLEFFGHALAGSPAPGAARGAAAAAAKPIDPSERST